METNRQINIEQGKAASTFIQAVRVVATCPTQSTHTPPNPNCINWSISFEALEK